jgi:hypothetical protein
MELLDSDDPIKSQLLRKSAHHREQLEEDVKLLSEKTEKMITNALIIGGALAAAYFVVSSFSKSKSKPKGKIRKVRIVKDKDSENTSVADEVVVANEEPQPPSVLGQIGTALASQATVMLLAFAKEKLSEYMASQSPAKERTNDNTE